MFEPVEGWGTWWFPRGNSKTPPPEYKRSVPLEGNVGVEAISDSTARYVVDSAGMHHQVLSCEPLGHPRLALHQNHYAVPTAPGSTLGSVDFNFRDQAAASFASFVDEIWTADSHPTGLSLKITEQGTTIPRYPAMTIRADGRVALGGGPAALPNHLVSLGIYRHGILELPKVSTYEDLLKNSDNEPFVNGAVVYVKDMDKVLISQGGDWHAILTSPVTKPDANRMVGEPRKDGQATMFGPRSTWRRGP